MVSVFATLACPSCSGYAWNMNVLVLNLTRFGDLIQTQPVVSGLTDAGDRVGLLCLDNFAHAGALLDGVDWLGSFPGARLLAALQKDWRGAVRDFDQLRRWVQREYAPDRIVNLTPSLPARLLARALSPNRSPDAVRGFSVDEYGFNADSSSWAAFLQLASGHRGASPFNVVDLFRCVAGVGSRSSRFSLKLPQGGEGERLEADVTALLHSQEEHGESRFLGIQLGASEDQRRWPVDAFLRTAHFFAKHQKLTPVLLGSDAETTLAERFVSGFAGSVINLVGRTSLTQLAGVLPRLELLVTNDTGTMHLAAGLGTPVAAVFLATAQPFDTGPYREGSLCFEPDISCHPCAFGSSCKERHRCRQSVSPEIVYRAAVAEFFSGGVEQAIPAGARVWRSVRGDDGFMDLESLSGHAHEDRTRWIGMQRRLYRRFFDDASLPSPGEKTAEPCGGLCSEQAERLTAAFSEARDLLFLLEQQSQVLATRPVRAVQNKVLATCQRVQSTLAREPELEVLGMLWHFELQSKGDALDHLVSLTRRHRALMEGFLSELS